MRRLLASLLTLLSLSAAAQSTEDALKARLLHKPLYLRQSWGADKLHFDATGALVGSAPLVSFTLCGAEVETVKLKGGSLQLTAHRVGLEFIKQVPKRVTLQVHDRFGPGTHDEELKLDLDAPAGGDYGAALDAIFTDKLEDLVPRMPLEWQSFANRHLLHQPSPEQISKGSTSGLKRVGGGVTAPAIINQPEPEFTDAARQLRWSGNVLVYFQIDTAGQPLHIRLLNPLGLGLDEQSILAVRKYRFSPALQNGQPVAVELNVAVNFAIY